MRKLIFSFFIIFFGFLFISSVQAFAGAEIVTISGTVTNGTDPIENTAITVIDSNSHATVGTTASNNSGYYSINVAPGTYNVIATPPPSSGFQSVTQLNQSITSNTTINFILVSNSSPPVTVSGHVTDTSGDPIVGASVAFVGTGGGSGTTDQNGFYSTQVVAGNFYQVNIISSSFPLGIQFSGRFQNLSFTSDSTFDLTLPQPRSLTITVSDPSGHPIAGAQLALAVHGNEISVNSSVGSLILEQSKNEDVSGLQIIMVTTYYNFSPHQ